MHRRKFLSVSSAAMAAVTLGAQDLFNKEGLIAEEPKDSCYEHFDVLHDAQDGTARIRCKTCKGSFWVDACLEENLRLHNNVLVPQCEWCKTHEGYGVPLVPRDWIPTLDLPEPWVPLRLSRKLDSVPPAGCHMDWADSAIEGWFYSRWGQITSSAHFNICRCSRPVWLLQEQSIYLASSKKIIWGEVKLVRDVTYLPYHLEKHKNGRVHYYLCSTERSQFETTA